jgi:hypothetical protein
MTIRPGLIALAVVLMGCARLSAPPPASAPAPVGATSNAHDSDTSPLGSPFAEERVSPGSIGTPLLIDRLDMRIGTTVQFKHIPTPSELHDLTLLPGLSRVVLSFDSWPREYAPLQTLNQAPEGVEVVVVLPGWPPSRAAVDAWNYLRVPVRAIVIVPGPPVSIDPIANLNEMRSLERVIAQMDTPSRQGFERLQRPLSFRKLVE